jgi:hypothetical protein
VEVNLSDGSVSIVDDDRTDVFQWRWQRSAGYASRTFKKDGKRGCVYLHRYIVGAQPGQIVDHINGNILDNRSENLRVVTKSQNNRNRQKKTRAKSGFWGVGKTATGKWRAYTTTEHGFKHISTHETPEEAAAARDAFLLEIKDTFRKPNFSGNS